MSSKEGQDPPARAEPPPPTVRTEPASRPEPDARLEPGPTRRTEPGPTKRTEPGPTRRTEPESRPRPAETRRIEAPPPSTGASAAETRRERVAPPRTAPDYGAPAASHSYDRAAVSGEIGLAASQTARQSQAQIDFSDELGSLSELADLQMGSWGSSAGSSGGAGSFADFGSNLEGVTRQASAAARKALLNDEAARAAAFARSLAALLGVTMLSLIYLGGPRWLVGFTEGWLGALLVTSLWVAKRAEAPKGYRRLHFRVFASMCVATSLSIEYYLGVFSPTPLVVTLGISFLATGEDRRFALGAPLAAALGYLLLAGLISFGVIPDLGRISANDLQLETKLFFVLMVPAVMLMTVWVSRTGRTILYSAIEDAHQAALLAGMREAQLAEVKQDLDAALNAGQGVGGRYTGAVMGEYLLGPVVGRGAMGEVYSAKQTTGSRIAAVKLLVQSVAADATLLARFQREGEITSGLDSPHLVKIFESGIAPDGAAFIAMELLSGRDLSWHLRQRGAFSLANCLMLMDHLCAGLDAAHGAGIVHRDIKPRNLFLAEVGNEEVWKILDFGVSKLKTATGTLTQSGLVGTPGYMAPEQAEARKVDERADLFAAGAVLYRVLTGRPPFSGDGPAQILYEVVHRQPQRPSKLVPDLPKQVEYVMAIALAKDPRHRFATGTNLFAALRDAAAGRLDDRLIRRAQRLIKAQPWGCVIHGEMRSLGPTSSMSAAIMMDS